MRLWGRMGANIIAFLLTSGFGVASLLAEAAKTPTNLSPPSVTDAPLTNVDDISRVANGILSVLAILFWIAAIGFIFYAAFLYLKSAGDAENVKKANRMLVYAIVAIVVGLMAYAGPTFVETALKGRGPSTP